MPVLYDLVESVRERLERLNVPVNAVAGFGHIGDGNLHLNVIADDYRKDVSDALEPFIYEWIQKQGGSISAEHGIGQMKSKYLKYSKSDNSIDLMRTIKQTFDPNGIMNPQKYLPQPPQ